VDAEILRNNSHKINSIVDNISLKFKDISIYKKFTHKRNLLGGVTVDWRLLDDWNSIRKEIEVDIFRISNKVDNNSEYPLFVQTYSSHPFVDIYSTVCSKATAYDNIKKIIHGSSNKFANKKILYLGDSENDNPAFRKADVSIGVKSDERLNPKLDCQYLINFNQLPKFFMRLLKNDFNFSEKLL
jgi:hydroxymethylpyrimidine pyrophosphatase-like HAD family hydrolase